MSKYKIYFYNDNGGKSFEYFNGSKKEKDLYVIENYGGKFIASSLIE